MPIPCLSLYREALKIHVTGLCEDTYLLYLSMSGSRKDPCSWPMRKLPIPRFSIYREALKNLVPGLCEDTPSPMLLSISGSSKDPFGRPMRRYPSPVSLYNVSTNNHCRGPMRRYPFPCFSLYREALKNHVAGLCEDIHPLLLSISGSRKDPCSWPMRNYPFPASLYIGKP